MTCEPNAAVNISAKTGLSSNGDYYPSSYRSHYSASSESHLDGFCDSSHASHQSQFDDQEDHMEQQQTLVDTNHHVNDPDKPKLLMWGLTKSGKTSVLKLIFEKMPPGDTLQLPETQRVQTHDLTCAAHVQFEIRDVPGPKAALASDFESYALESTTVVFILDVTEDYLDAINLLISSVQWLYSKGRTVRFEVLIHKIDGLQEQERSERYSTIQQQVNVMLHECSVTKPLINFYETSIYDYSIYEAFSKIVQNQMRHLRALENMLDVVTAATQLDKIFVCDISNKIFLASDTRPVERQLSQLCCDVINVYTDLSSIYRTSNSPVLDSTSFCTIGLTKGPVLYLKDINSTTALICILKRESKYIEGVMEHNLNILKKYIQELFLINSTRH